MHCTRMPAKEIGPCSSTRIGNERFSSPQPFRFVLPKWARWHRRPRPHRLPPAAQASPATTAATPPADPTLGIAFDIVSIRPTSEGMSTITNPPNGDGLVIEHSTLLEIIRWNY